MNRSRLVRGLHRLFGAVKQSFRVLPQYLELKGGGQNVRFALRLRDAKLCLADATATTGFDRHYVFHTAWAARILSKTRPVLHTDISSSLYFIANVSAFIPVKFLDYRPANLGLSGVSEDAVDLLGLPFADDSIPSLSCMHVVEHVGLGRYGDSMNYDGDLQAARELQRVLSPGGHLLFVVPIAAHPRIQFNAHRIYAPAQVAEMFDALAMEDFTLIPDDAADGSLVSWPSDELMARQSYACGCFLFVKKPKPEKDGRVAA